MISIIIKSSLLSVIVTFGVIKYFTRKNIKQFVYEDAPKSHLLKQGTPTMGGIGMIVTMLIMILFYKNLLDQNIVFLMILMLGFTFIGIFDDSTKILKRKNKGLSAKTKMILQVFFASIFTGFVAFANNSCIQGPLSCLSPIIYYFLLVFIIVGASNSVNLTDGLDGLAAGTMLISLLGFGYFAFIDKNLSILIFILILIGVLLGFLWFNVNPAKIFMGDAGSLSLGALLAGIAILLHRELFLIPLGLIFIAETLSVILQVTYFKLTKGKRIFKMSPLHHHFELCGWSENNIVTRFWILAIIGLLLAINFA